MTEKEYGRIVAENLRRIAYEADKTQADIAHDLNISKATISSWMNGTRVPRMQKIDLLCHYFNCKRSDIMEEHHRPTQQYYMDPVAAAYAQKVFDNPELRMLLDAAENVKPENIELAAEMLKRFKETNSDG